jgi:toxin ParE1/3/4
MYEILLDPAAEKDLDGIIDWYEKQRSGLGYEFLLMFEECIAAIERNPFHTFNVTRRVRRIAVPRFPYNIYYTVRMNKVFIHVIMHQYRNPEEWQKRI